MDKKTEKTKKIRLTGNPLQELIKAMRIHRNRKDHSVFLPREADEARADLGDTKATTDQAREERSRSSPSSTKLDSDSCISSKESISRLTCFKSMFNPQRKPSKGKRVATLESSREFAPPTQAVSGTSSSRQLVTRQRASGSSRPASTTAQPSMYDPQRPFKRGSASFSFHGNPMAADGDLPLQDVKRSDERGQTRSRPRPSTSSLHRIATSGTARSSLKQNAVQVEDLSVQRAGGQGSG